MTAKHHSPPPAINPVSAGRKLGHFAILEPIGHGGVGTVYRAWDVSLNRQVALKVLDRELGSNDPPIF